MKKLKLLGLLLLSLNAYGDIILKGGGSFNGSFNDEYWQAETKTSVSYQGALEIRKDLTDYLALGFGSGYYQGARLEKRGDDSTKGKDENAVLFNSIPVYITTQFYLPKSEDFRAYLKLNGGYSYNLDDHLSELLGEKIENGYYYGAGFGVEAKRLIFEVMYEVNEGSILVDDIYKRTDYNRVSAFIGIRF